MPYLEDDNYISLENLLSSCDIDKRTISIGIDNGDIKFKRSKDLFESILISMDSIQQLGYVIDPSLHEVNLRLIQFNVNNGAWSSDLENGGGITGASINRMITLDDLTEDNVSEYVAQLSQSERIRSTIAMGHVMIDDSAIEGYYNVKSKLDHVYNKGYKDFTDGFKDFIHSSQVKKINLYAKELVFWIAVIELTGGLTRRAKYKNLPYCYKWFLTQKFNGKKFKTMESFKSKLKRVRKVFIERGDIYRFICPNFYK